MREGVYPALQAARGWPVSLQPGMCRGIAQAASYLHGQAARSRMG
nr:MAG TPA: hypothetical protein [Caudoviricetes sp.]